jgi:hypothetical protein
MLRPEGLNQTQQTAPTQAPAKAPYERPTLVVYGDVRTLTQSIGGHGPLDGAHRGLTPLRSAL